MFNSDQNFKDKDSNILLYKIKKWSKKNNLLHGFNIDFILLSDNTNNPSCYIEIRGKHILSRIFCTERGDCDIEVFIFRLSLNSYSSSSVLYTQKGFLLYLDHHLEVLINLEKEEDINFRNYLINYKNKKA